MTRVAVLRRGAGAPFAALVVVFLAAFALLARGEALAAEPTFPALSGRVVDAAGILKPDETVALEAQLKAYEEKTSDQVVVATVPNLQGLTIEDYGNRLFRAWAIGQAKTNNGALLLVAPNDRKVRIEVGYGLEGALTDALSKVIITTSITPRFKAGDYGGGIKAGVDAMLSILSGDADEWQRQGKGQGKGQGKVRSDEAAPSHVVGFIVLFLVILFVVHRMNRGRRGGGFIILPGPSSGGWSGGVSGGFGDGGGFSGGGGSSGGGGASGDW
ncbi:TPM domain-containing protein [Methylobacterium sp. E-045]|uniref:TPM domain-containing protein n=1 Tax=Methylobacterium sp. E-045 TaxID=2836575 RepID=UPI00391A1877